MTCKPDSATLPFAGLILQPSERCTLNIRSPGRPRDMEKREAILDAAQTLFSERGIEGVSIEGIAAASGVSKVTVYNHFCDKSAIFRTMIEREQERLGRVIAEAVPESGTLEDRLNNFGVPLLTMLNAPCHIALGRTMAMEVTRNPEIGRQFYEAGPGRTLELLVALLNDAASRGDVTLDDPRRAAEDLVSLWMGFRMMERSYFPETSPPDAAETFANVSHGTRLFLRAYGRS